VNALKKTLAVSKGGARDAPKAQAGKRGGRVGDGCIREVTTNRARDQMSSGVVGEEGKGGTEPKKVILRL